MAIDAETRREAENASRPSLLMEQRAGWELAQLMASPVYYGCGVPRGDGSSVLVLPGFMGSDRYLTIFRGWLQRMGYRPERSELFINAGNPFELISHVLHRAEEIVERDGEPVTVVGHSLGGILGHLSARLRPDLIANVFTLGSPLNEAPRKATHPVIRALADMLVRDPDIPFEEFLEQETALIRPALGAPLSRKVGLTSIYTRTDAVVTWNCCLPDDPEANAYEVSGSHTGLAWNPEVYRLLGRLLAEARSEAVAAA